MRNEHASRDGSREFTGTSSYDQAIKLLKTGYTEAAKLLREDVKQKDKIQSKFQSITNHPCPHTAVQGFIPHVPNAIMNLPNSMISIDRKPQKRKTLSIVYVETGNCSKDQEYFIKSGAALLSAVSLIEKSGIQTKIDVGFFAGCRGDEDKGTGEIAIGTVRVKNFGERYSFQKVSFPMVHPSMFRRIGFKWLETVPYLEDETFSCGYGRSPEHKTLVREMKLPPNSYLVSTHWVHEHGCSVEEILKYLEVI